MTEYQQQALDFLEKCNAKMTITYDCLRVNPLWNDNELRGLYRITLTTPKGRTSFNFWNSVYNTERHIAPKEYDILACLEKYDVGTFNDFVNEFGYEVDEYKDKVRANKIYKAVVKEYENLCRIFTEEQMEMLREIQ